MSAKIEIEWKGETLTIREDQAFEAAAEVEQVFNLGHVTRMQEAPLLVPLSKGFAALVNFAGGEATPEEVWRSANAAIKQGEDEAIMMASMLQALSMILLDGAPDAEDAPAGAPEKTTRPSPKAAS